MKGNVLRLSILLKRSITFKNIQLSIADILNSTMKNNDFLNELHTNTRMKLYSYNCLTPIENEGVYKIRNNYQFEVKSLDKLFLENLKKELIKNNNDLFIVRRADILEKDLTDLQIDSIYTITPYVLVGENKHTKFIKTEDDKRLLRERIIKNTNKKYNIINNSKIEAFDFMENIITLNKYPIAFDYKGGKIVGNKAKIFIKKDEMSQKMAKMLLFTGILEKNSLSFGCCICGKGEII
ncbi:CRISPR-associated endoribonuclease Cas6 [Clostridium ihumii]|uniref:CRISPR-associated endoribonuclease Cas6 n=1 Tax=Clostridium ihumii TaxID=1470356 RepID=UPI003D32CA5A